MLALAHVVAMQTLYGLLELLDETLLLRVVNQEVIGRDAGLASIESLTPRYALRGNRHIGALIHDAGTLTAQFKHYGREILRRSTHHELTERGATRKEDNIVTLLQQRGIHITITLHDSHILLVEGLGNHLLDGLRHVRHIGRGLQQRRTTRRNGTHQRVEQQLHGVVPRRDDKRLSQRLAHNTRTRWHHFQWCRATLGLHPLFQVAQMILHLALDNAQLGEYRLLHRFMQVLPQGIAQRLGPLLQRLLQTAKLFLAEIIAQRSARTEKFALRLNDGYDTLFGCIFNLHILLFVFQLYKCYLGCSSDARLEYRLAQAAIDVEALRALAIQTIPLLVYQ